MKRKPTTDADLASAQAEIDHLVANPPPRRDPEKGKHVNYDAVSILKDVNGFRTKLAKDRGLTLAQWLELEAKVQHPREVIPVQPSIAAIARRRMIGAGVPDLFITAVADRKPLDCTPLTCVQEFLNCGDGFHVLSGGKGTRKTGSACWALGQLDSGKFLHSRDITRLSIEQRDKWDAICSAPLVVLDDLGTEKRDEKGAFSSAVSELIDRVYSNRRRMIITCNLDKETFAQVYGEREFDRLREVGKWSYIAGQSVRQYDPALHLEREPGCDDE